MAASGPSSISDASTGWVSGCTSLPTHCHRLEGEGQSPVQAMQDRFSARWTLLRFSWTGGFGAPLYGGSSGLSGLRHILSHPDSPPSQTILEIRLRGSGLPVHGPTLWAVSGPPYFYEVHGRGSFPSKTDANPHSQLHRRLAHSGPVRGGTTFTQNPHPQPLRAPGAQGQFCQ